MHYPKTKIIGREFTRDGVVLIAEQPWSAEEALKHVIDSKYYFIQACKLILIFKDTTRKKKTRWLIETGGELIDDNPVCDIVKKGNNYARIDNWACVKWYTTLEGAQKERL